MLNLIAQVGPRCDDDNDDDDDDDDDDDCGYCAYILWWRWSSILCGYDDDHSNEVINGDGILWRGISCDDDGVI